jgi:uncharacterized protein (UPF0335 family)
MSFTIGQLFNSLLGKERVSNRNLKQEIDTNKDNIFQAAEIDSFDKKLLEKLDSFTKTDKTDDEDISAISMVMSFFRDQPQKYSSNKQDVTQEDIKAMMENNKNVLDREATDLNLMTILQGIKYDSQNDLLKTTAKYCEESNRNPELGSSRFFTTRSMQNIPEEICVENNIADIAIGETQSFAKENDANGAGDKVNHRKGISPLNKVVIVRGDEIKEVINSAQQAFDQKGLPLNFALVQSKNLLVGFSLKHNIEDINLSIKLIPSNYLLYKEALAGSKKAESLTNPAREIQYKELKG